MISNITQETANMVAAMLSDARIVPEPGIEGALVVLQEQQGTPNTYAVYVGTDGGTESAMIPTAYVNDPEEFGAALTEADWETGWEA